MSLAPTSEARISLEDLKQFWVISIETTEGIGNASYANSLERGICSRIRKKIYSDTELGNKELEQRRQATYNTSEYIT